MTSGDTSEPEPLSADDPRVGPRAELTAEEQTAGSADPIEQAEIILEESEERVLDREEQLEEVAERRHSEDLVDPN